MKNNALLERMRMANSTGLSNLRCLLYGDGGVGKTTSATTLPEDRLVVVNTEQKALPLEGLNTPLLNCSTWEETEEWLRFLQNRDWSGVEELAHFDKRDIVFIDSLTGVALQLLEHIVGKERKELMERRAKAKNSEKANGLSVYDEQLTMEDWGLYQTKLTNLIRGFHSLPAHIIWTGHALWSQDDNGSRVRTPDLNTRLKERVSRYFDLVFYMDVKTVQQGDHLEKHRVFQTDNDGQIRAKGHPALETYEAPNWSAIFRKINKHKTNRSKENE